MLLLQKGNTALLKSKHTVSFIQVIDTDFLRIRSLINTSGVLWKTSQTSKSYAVSVNVGFKYKGWALNCIEQSLDYLYEQLGNGKMPDSFFTKYVLCTTYA